MDTGVVKFETFSMRDTLQGTRDVLNWLDRPTGRKEVYYYRKYTTHAHLYHAVSDFVTRCGLRLVAITGSAVGESCGDYSSGEVVVWYRDVGKLNAIDPAK